ncbi:hypothetical protein LC087_06860 [Bacillus carboniphilus]|uniref:Uncharacterized protein n=1 Tax=Bacillus carboniphilus TaxID=86663 RepID=A0ABY9JWS4_9BACI|nr:hypothetical protein [Bacillus carboniphilus]WLR43836.1 hypothetical protein LC087_06860 [Bacillus carboniphilus]
MSKIKKLLIVTLFAIAGYAMMPSEEASASQNRVCQVGSTWGWDKQTLCLSVNQNGWVKPEIYSDESKTYYIKAQIISKSSGTLSSRNIMINRSNPYNYFTYYSGFSKSSYPLKFYVRFYSDSARTKYLGALNLLIYTGLINNKHNPLKRVGLFLFSYLFLFKSIYFSSILLNCYTNI